MQSKFVLFATTLTLLITATPSFADGTSNTDVKTNKTEDKAIATNPKEAKPDKKTETDAASMPTGKDGAEELKFFVNPQLRYLVEPEKLYYESEKFYYDPCQIDPCLPACPCNGK